MKTPYPGRYESFESWMRRCDEAERRQHAENEDRYNSSPDGRGLTDKQAAKLAKVQGKLPKGWHYTVTNDNQQICLAVPRDSSLCCATKHKGKAPDVHVGGNGVRGAILALVINRATAAVWGWQGSWYSCFLPEEWTEAYATLKSGQFSKYFEIEEAA